MSKENGKVEEIKNDVKDVSNTVKNEPHNVKRTIKYRLKKNLHFIVLGFALLLVGIFYFFGGVEISQAMVIAGGAMVISIVFLYPYATRVVDYFVEDTRKPVLDIESVEDDLGVFKVPDTRIGDIDIIDGTARDWDTSLGIGKEVKEFREEITEDGKSQLIARATWEGSKSPLELKRDYSAIDAMENNLEKWARKGVLYDAKLPHMVHEIQAQTSNDLVYEFQGLANYNGQDIHETVQDMVTEYEIEDETSDEDSDDEALEKLAQMVEDNDMNFGDSNGE